MIKQLGFAYDEMGCEKPMEFYEHFEPPLVCIKIPILYLEVGIKREWEVGFKFSWKDRQFIRVHDMGSPLKGDAPISLLRRALPARYHPHIYLL
jgi:hypothetical protein